MTTWNGADRISSKSPSFFGRPNTWGQRYANVILQQSDLLIAVGTRLGLQQTGFNWQSFMPVGKVAQIEIDLSELTKENPKVDFLINHDANDFMIQLSAKYSHKRKLQWDDWISFCNIVKGHLPISENCNVTKSNYINPFDFMIELSKRLTSGDSVIPSSSGAAETVAMQAINQVESNTVITSKGLASMGYGLAGAIGCAVNTKGRVFHIEGDGGFAQNLQELGTVRSLNLPIKTFILCNDGYASIRMTQKSYFNGNYIGCDSSTGLGLPNWEKLFDAFDIPVYAMDKSNFFDSEIDTLLNSSGPTAFLVSVDPEQTYFPKITSRVLPDGTLESNPLHLMTPDLDPILQSTLLKYL
jgi:acetolactate synthase-1/2/3 large subunit